MVAPLCAIRSTFRMLVDVPDVVKTRSGAIARAAGQWCRPRRAKPAAGGPRRGVSIDTGEPRGGPTGIDSLHNKGREVVGALPLPLWVSGVHEVMQPGHVLDHQRVPSHRIAVTLPRDPPNLH